VSRLAGCRRGAGVPSSTSTAARAQIVRRPLPHHVVASAVWQIGRLLRLHVRENFRQPLVFHDRARFNRSNLIEQFERQIDPVRPYRKSAVDVVYDFDFLAYEAAGQWCRIEDQHHPVIVQGQVLGNCSLFAPCQNLIEVLAGRQRPVQVFTVPRRTPEARVVISDEAGEPLIRCFHR